MTTAVLGLGLIGGSLAKSLLARGYQVRGFDVDPLTRDAAARAGVEAVASIADLCAAEPEVLVLAVPLAAIPDAAAEVAQHVAPSTVVTDVGSVKTAVRGVIDAAGLGTRYVGAHPMAGTERSGFAASSANLLDGVPWAVTIAPDTSAQHLLTVLHLITDAFGATVHPLTDDVHDQSAALISHVPHVLANELLNVVARAPVRRTALGLAAGSFRDGTRVARTDDVARTQAMVASNSAWVAPTLRAIIRDLDELASSLESGEPIGQFFDRAAELRSTQLSPGAHAAAGEQLRVSLTESEWRSILTDLGAAGAHVTGVDLDDQSVVLRPAPAVLA